jgi:type III restriction enzyme
VHLIYPADPIRVIEYGGQAIVLVENYHTFKLRERIELSKGTRALIQGRGKKLDTLETRARCYSASFRNCSG